MNSNAETEGMGRKTLDVVLFRLGPFLLGAPAAQVECIRHGALPQTDSNGDMLDLRDIFSTPSGEATGFPPAFLEVVGGPRSKVHSSGRGRGDHRAACDPDKETAAPDRCA